MDSTILKKLGLSEKEVKVYLSLLEYGAISIRGLADLTGLNRGTVYDILKRLQEWGLVSFYHQKTKQQFVAEKPERLLRLAEEREKEAARIKDQLGGFIPELSALADKGASSPVTKYYEGKNGVKAILEDVLESQNPGEEYYVYSARKASEDLNAAFPDFTKARVKKGIKVKAISMAEGGKLSGLDERKWLGTKDDSATFIIIYSEKCAFVSRDAKEQPVGVIIENKMVYETQKKIFLQLWRLIN
jgi:sugar-specific transcriptional regulator TrmB